LLDPSIMDKLYS